MRLIVWNCNMAFRKKADRILQLKPDLVVVPECENKAKLNFPETTQSPSYNIWVGDNKSKGLGVLSYGALKLKIHSSYCTAFKHVIPVAVSGSGSVKFVLIAVWAKNNTKNRYLRYIGGVYSALQHYRRILKEPIIIAGDFNWFKALDENSKYLAGNLTDTAKLLQQKGIESVYHKFRSENFGEESEPTLYFRRNRKKSYHIDYIFASSDLVRRLRKIEVGDYKTWIDYSDHMPLIATFENM